LHHRDSATAEHELVVVECRHVAGEQLAAPSKPRLQILGRGSERGRGIGLGARDLGRDPKSTVHAMARDEVPGVVDDSHRNQEAEFARLGDAAADALDGVMEREGHGMATQISPESTRTGYEGTLAPRPGKVHAPVRMSYIHPCQGHASRNALSLPSL